MRDGASWSEMEACIKAGLRMKAIMKKKGQTEAESPCAKCRGTIRAKIDRRGNILFRCDGPCQREMFG